MPITEYEGAAAVSEVKIKDLRRPTPTFLDNIRRHCERTPNKVAVMCSSGTLTYGELWSQAGVLASNLGTRGVAADVPVGICVNRSHLMLVALLGVLRAGGAYVPLDPEFPIERLRFMLEDSGARLLVTEQQLIQNFTESQVEVVCIDTAGEETGESEEEVLAPVSACDLAYVIYTSGSTGRPKGVMIEHGALLNLLESMACEPGLDSSDVLLAVTTLSFDIAGLELFLPLMVGGRVVLAARSEARDPNQLMQLLESYRVTAMQATPVTWRMLLQSGWKGKSNLKALCGGEALARDLADALLDRVGSLWNLYGPTETTIWSSVEQVKREAAQVPIGRPIANTTMYVLDEYLRPVPNGAAGELYIGGAGLARGYQNQPQLTAERFVRNPLEAANCRMYRTGDQARLRSDGRLEYLGRNDHQVKINGYRIELEEIETHIRQRFPVSDCAVVPRETAGESQLIAFLVPSNRNLPWDVKSLRSELAQSLPQYMVPSRFVDLAELPLTANGKIDRKTLLSRSGEVELTELDFVAPRTDLEQKLTEIFERVLGKKRIGITANFFALGGHSLLAVKLFSEIATVFKCNLPPSTVFRAPTVELLALLLDEEGVRTTWSSLVPIKPAGDLPPFFCVHPLGSNLVRYRKLAELLGPNRPFYGFQAGFRDERSKAAPSVEEMAAEYIDAIRKVQANGPYHLGGWSFGGTVAFEMAQQLLARGEQVELLALVDSFFLPKPEHYPERREPYSMLWKLDRYLGETLFRRGTEPFSYAWGVLRNVSVELVRSVRRAMSKKARPMDPMSKKLAEIERANACAERAYVPKPYPGKVTLFWCSDWSFRVFHDTRLGWSNVAEGGLEVHVVPGNHKTLWESPNVSTFAAKLKRCLKPR